MIFFFNEKGIKQKQGEVLKIPPQFSSQATQLPGKDPEKLVSGDHAAIWLMCASGDQFHAHHSKSAQRPKGPGLLLLHSFPKTVFKG